MKNTIVSVLLLSVLSAASQQHLPLATQIAETEMKAATNFQKSLRIGNSMASADFNVTYYRCEWDLDPAVRYIRGVVTSYFSITVATNTITFDLHNGLTVDSVIFRKQAISYQQTPANNLTIRFPQTLPVNQQDSVSIYYQGIPPNEGLGSFVTSVQNGTPVLWTLSEPYGAKDWWPCKNGTDDKADSIDIVVTYPDQYSSSSNGLLLYQTKRNGKQTDHWQHRYPIASYLVAVAITNYVVEKDSARINNSMLPVKMYSYRANTVDFRNATLVARECLEKFSSLWGPYPFLKESYSQTQFGWGGGMEHQTNSFITNSQSQVAAHELSHQWFGDKVTCNSWTDIWLNEGFASYAQIVYLENFEPATLMANVERNRKFVTSVPGGSMKVNDTSSIGRIFDSRLSYNKGACVLRMIRWRLGDSLFFRAIRQYLNDPLVSYRSASTKDLIRNLEQASGQSFSEFFKDWYEGEGFPSYQLHWTINRNNWIKITLNQTVSHPSVAFFEMPVPVLLKQNGGRDTLMVLNNTKNGEEFWLNPGFKTDTVIFDPDIMLLSDGNTVIKSAVVENRQNLIQIFPNPVQANLTVSVKNPTGTKISVHLLNAAAQLINSKEVVITGRDELINISTGNLPAGMYWLQIGGTDFKVTRKVMKL